MAVNHLKPLIHNKTFKLTEKRSTKLHPFSLKELLHLTRLPNLQQENEAFRKYGLSCTTKNKRVSPRTVLLQEYHGREKKKNKLLIKLVLIF